MSIEKKENIAETAEEIKEKIKQPAVSRASKAEKEEKKSLYQRINIFLEDISPISLEEKIFFTKHLRVMIRSGISLSKALTTLSLQTSNKRFGRIITAIAQNVEAGNSFSDSLKKYPKVFNELFISMVEAGEASGKMEDVLEQLQRQMVKDYELVSKVKGAMIYPSIVLFAMLLIGVAMIVFVIPKITEMFAEANATLPLPTRILIGLSDFMVAHGFFVFFSACTAAAAFIYVIKQPKGRFYWHMFILKAPIIGPIAKKINLARFARTFSSLLATDIPIVKVFEISARVLGNVRYKKALLEAKEKVKTGISIKESLAPYELMFPVIVQQMISVGEETGALDNILEELAVFYEDEVSDIMTALPSIIEPVLMLILGLGVGAMAVAIIMPMYSMTQVL